jgi:hypothetical protein
MGRRAAGVEIGISLLWRLLLQRPVKEEEFGPFIARQGIVRKVFVCLTFRRVKTYDVADWQKF